jgi:hypothetical protein
MRGLRDTKAAATIHFEPRKQDAASDAPDLQRTAVAISADDRATRIGHEGIDGAMPSCDVTAAQEMDRHRYRHRKRPAARAFPASSLSGPWRRRQLTRQRRGL